MQVREGETRWARFKRSWWLVVVPLLTFGVFGGPVLAWAGVRARRAECIAEGVFLFTAFFGARC